MCLPLCPYQEATPKQLCPNTNASAYLATRQCFNCQFVNLSIFQLSINISAQSRRQHPNSCSPTLSCLYGMCLSGLYGNTQTAVAYLANMICAYLASRQRPLISRRLKYTQYTPSYHIHPGLRLST